MSGPVRVRADQLAYGDRITFPEAEQLGPRPVRTVTELHGKLWVCVAIQPSGWHARPCDPDELITRHAVGLYRRTNTQKETTL